MRIIGIDPGSTATGWGVIERARGRWLHVAHGTLRAPRATPLPARLAALHAALAEVIGCHRPDAACVARVFVAASPRAALVLGQARGVALAAAAAAGLPVSEYSASQIKQAVTGSGAAGKQQMQLMVARLLALAAAPPSDAADALAAALCHGQAGPLAALVGAAVPRRSGRFRSGRFVLRQAR